MDESMPGAPHLLLATVVAACGATSAAPTPTPAPIGHGERLPDASAGDPNLRLWVWITEPDPGAEAGRCTATRYGCDDDAACTERAPMRVECPPPDRVLIERGDHSCAYVEVECVMQPDFETDCVAEGTPADCPIAVPR